jgi:hypothetical protein
MPRSKRPTVSLEEVKARFDEWRRNRKGKASIPDELWSAAAVAPASRGTSRTSGGVDALGTTGATQLLLPRNMMVRLHGRKQFTCGHGARILNTGV